ncbi:MAG: Ig-like domain-containing protein [Terriglobales bacterium]
MAFASVCFGQQVTTPSPIPTNRSDNARSGANVTETILTPNNVNKDQFGALFNYPIDYLALAQPLYVPNVTIPGKGTHNVVYVATMADSVYAFDADSNAGTNATPLWWVNFTNPALYGPGITTANTLATLPCSGGTTTGFTQEGIAGTPTIDTTTGTMYVVAKTVQNGTVYHYLHALNIATGLEVEGGPVQITATSTSAKGHVTNFSSLHQLNRPALLLSNGVVYIGFGSNGCNDNNTGWILAYEESNLKQVGSFNTSPDIGFTSIWQTGNGLAADEFGNIYAVTAEDASSVSANDAAFGGSSYSNSVIEFKPNPALPNNLVLTQWFAPDDVLFLNTDDLDLSSGGPVILPDQAGAAPHLVVAAGKTGRIYVLNRDDLGLFNSQDSQLSALPTGTGGQELDGEENKLDGIVGSMFSSPAYWNGMLYYAGDADEIKAFQLTGTYPPVSTEPVMQTHRRWVGSHSPSISANGTTNGILWVLSGGILLAFNASDLEQELYASNMVPARDTLPPVAHFVTQTIANGKVYIATQTTLSVYGILENLTLVSGGNQNGTVKQPLPAAIMMQVVDPYSGNGISGVTVTFSDNGAGGSFNPASVVSSSTAGSIGDVSTIYTSPKQSGVVTITASLQGAGDVSFTETAVPGPAVKLYTYAGGKQSGPEGSILPKALEARIEDAYGNGIPSITVTFADNNEGVLNPSSAMTNANGLAETSYQLPNTAGKYTITASAPGLGTTKFVETAIAADGSATLAGAPASLKASTDHE